MTRWDAIVDGDAFFGVSGTAGCHGLTSNAIRPAARKVSEMTAPLRHPGGCHHAGCSDLQARLLH
jgi:hypothetical protein